MNFGAMQDWSPAIVWNREIKNIKTLHCCPRDIMRRFLVCSLTIEACNAHA